MRAQQFDHLIFDSASLSLSASPLPGPFSWSCFLCIFDYVIIIFHSIRCLLMRLLLLLSSTRFTNWACKLATAKSKRWQPSEQRQQQHHRNQYFVLIWNTRAAGAHTGPDSLCETWKQREMPYLIQEIFMRNMYNNLIYTHTNEFD